MSVSGDCDTEIRRDFQKNNWDGEEVIFRFLIEGTIDCFFNCD